MNAKLNLKNFINAVIPIGLILVWLMPVSNQRGVLNSGLNNRMYICFITVIFVMFIFDLISGKKLNKKMFAVIIFCTALLLMFSLFTSIMQPGIAFGWKEFATMATMFLVLGYRFNVLKPNKIWQLTFYIASTVIAICGILMLLGNTRVWDFFATNYANHYSYVYEEFEVLRKPVTFFAANSITCSVYFMIYFIWEICESENHKHLSRIYKIVYLILIVGCFNNSAIMCVGLIVLYYLFNSAEKFTKRRLFMNIAILLVIIIAAMYSADYLQSILFSKTNGILGRYSSSGAGNVIVNIRYLLGFNMPTGCMLVENLYFTDSGMIVYALRGSVELTICIYYLLYNALQFYTKDKFLTRFFFVSILGFEVAYPILVAQRFLPLLCFFLIYIKGNRKIECSMS